MQYVESNPRLSKTENLKKTPQLICSEMMVDIISMKLDQDANKKEYSENICTKFLTN